MIASTTGRTCTSTTSTIAIRADLVAASRTWRSANGPSSPSPGSAERRTSSNRAACRPTSGSGSTRTPSTSSCTASGSAAARASVAVDLSRFAGDEDQSPATEPITIGDSFGASTTGILELPFTGGRNKLALQYGKGAAYDFRSVVQPPAGRTFEPGEHVDIDELWQFRVVNDLLDRTARAMVTSGARDLPGAG